MIRECSCGCGFLGSEAECQAHEKTCPFTKTDLESPPPPPELQQLKSLELFQCEHGCGFMGSFELVEKHEKACRFKPPTRQGPPAHTKAGPHEAQQRAEQVDGVFKCEYGCGFCGTYADVLEHEATKCLLAGLTQEQARQLLRPGTRVQLVGTDMLAQVTSYLPTRERWAVELVDRDDESVPRAFAARCTDMRLAPGSVGGSGQTQADPFAPTSVLLAADASAAAPPSPTRGVGLCSTAPTDMVLSPGRTSVTDWSWMLADSFFQSLVSGGPAATTTEEPAPADPTLAAAAAAEPDRQPTAAPTSTKAPERKVQAL